MDCGLRGSTQHPGLEIPAGMGWRCGVGEVVSAVEVDVFVGGGGEMGEVPSLLAASLQ